MNNKNKNDKLLDEINEDILDENDLLEETKEINVKKDASEDVIKQFNDMINEINVDDINIE